MNNTDLFLKCWKCVECMAIQPETGEYPTCCWSCDGSDFIRDEIKIPSNANVGTKESEL